MSAPFEKFKVGDYIHRSRGAKSNAFTCFWRVHMTPESQSDGQCADQRRFIEDAIREKLERAQREDNQERQP